MAAISIKGIRIDAVDIKLSDNEGGGSGISSSYSLLSSADKVLAKQKVGGYGDMRVEPAADTVKAMNDFIKLYKRDVNSVLGLDTE